MGQLAQKKAELWLADGLIIKFIGAVMINIMLGMERRQGKCGLFMGS